MMNSDMMAENIRTLRNRGVSEEDAIRQAASPSAGRPMMPGMPGAGGPPPTAGAPAPPVGLPQPQMRPASTGQMMRPQPMMSAGAPPPPQGPPAMSPRPAGPSMEQMLMQRQRGQAPPPISR